MSELATALEGSAPARPSGVLESRPVAFEKTERIQIVPADAYGETHDVQSVHRQHQSQDWQGSGILPSSGEREGSCQTQRATGVAQIGLRAGTWSRERDHLVHPEPRTRKEENPGRCQEGKSQEVMVERPGRDFALRTLVSA